MNTISDNAGESKWHILLLEMFGEELLGACDPSYVESTLLPLVALLAKGYRECRVSSLLERYCPLPRDSGIVPDIPHKRTRRGTRGGRGSVVANRRLPRRIADDRAPLPDVVVVSVGDRMLNTIARNSSMSAKVTDVICTQDLCVSATIESAVGMTNRSESGTSMVPHPSTTGALTKNQKRRLVRKAKRHTQKQHALLDVSPGAYSSGNLSCSANMSDPAADGGYALHMSRTWPTAIAKDDLHIRCPMAVTRAVTFPTGRDLPRMPGDRAAKRKLLEMEGGPDHPVDLLSLRCPVEDVSRFVVMVCRCVFPKMVVWGSRHNLDKFLRHLDTYIRLGRNEEFSLKDAVSGIRTREVPWLRAAGSSGGQECADSHQLFLSFVLWVYRDFVNPLLRVCFYITEAEGRGFEVLHYRKPVWSFIVRKGLNQLQQQFLPVVLTDDLQMLPQAGKRDDVAQEPGVVLSAEPLLSAHPKSLLLNDLLRQHKYAAANTRLENRRIIERGRRREAMSAKLRSFLMRIPNIRFVPKKNAVRAITNLRSKRNSGTKYTLSSASSTSSGTSEPTLSEVLTNSSLYNCLHVLRHVSDCSPGLRGFGVFGMDDIYLRMKQFRQQLHRDFLRHRNCTGIPLHCDDLFRLWEVGADVEEDRQDLASSPLLRTDQHEQYYMAALDLEKCYDNVDTRALYDLVRDIMLREGGARDDSDVKLSWSSGNEAALAAAADSVLERELVIHKYLITHFIASMDRVVTKSVRHVTRNGEILRFQDVFPAIAAKYRNCIISDTVVHTKITLREVLRLLKIHLFSHVIKIPSSARELQGQRYFTQVKGIPQGSVLSPILCNLYYGNAERELFGSDHEQRMLGLSDGRSVIMRLMDDYIMVSADRACTQYFAQHAHQSLPRYGSTINALKTRVNFPCQIRLDGQLVTLPQISTEAMPWCGLLIDCRTLAVMPSFQRLLDRPLESSFSVELKEAGKALMKVVKSFVRMKCHALVLDSALNSKNTIATTLREMYSMAACRTLAYIAKLQRCGVRMDEAIVLRAIEEGLLFGARLIHSRTRDKRTRDLSIPAARFSDSFEDSGEVCAPPRREFLAHRSLTGPAQFGECAVTQREALLIGAKAFLSVFESQGARFPHVVRRLKGKVFGGR